MSEINSINQLIAENRKSHERLAATIRQLQLQCDNRVSHVNHFVKLLSLNVSNDKLSDADFRALVLSSIQLFETNDDQG